MKDLFEQRFGSRGSFRTTLRREVAALHRPTLPRLVEAKVEAEQSIPAMRILSIVAVLGLWLLLNVRLGYRLEDSVLYLTMAKQQLDPSLYPNNPLVDHLRRMPYPLYRAMTLILDGPLGLWGHVVAAVAMRLAFVAALWLLMKELTELRWAAFLGCLAVILQPLYYGTLAWTELISPEFVQGDLGKIVLMGAVVAWLRGRPILTATILGLGFTIHPIYSVATAVMLWPDAIWRARRLGMRQILAALATGAVLAAPTVVSIIRSLPSSGGATEADQIQLIRFFNYFHVYPSLFHRWEYVGFIGAATAGVVAYAIIAPQLADRAGMLLRFAMGIGLWCAVGTLFVEWMPRVAVMQMMPFRVTLAVRLLATGMVVFASIEMIRRRAWVPVGLAVAWLTMLMLAVKFVPWITLVVALWLLGTRRGVRSMGAAILAAVSCGLMVWIDPDQLPWRGGFPWTAIGVVAAGFGLLLLEPRITRWLAASELSRQDGARAGRLPTREASLVGLPLKIDGRLISGGLISRLCWVTLIILAGMVRFGRQSNGVWGAQLTSRPWLSPGGYDTGQDAWQGVMRWARTYTAGGATFITPPDLLGWTWYSERNTLATYQLGMQSVWDRRYGPTMKARLADIGCVRPWAPGSNYHAFDERRLLDVVRRYHVDYIVWKKSERNRMDWPTVYENRDYLVYDVRRARDTARWGDVRKTRDHELPACPETVAGAKAIAVARAGRDARGPSLFGSRG